MVTILVDVDGVLADYVSHALAHTDTGLKADQVTDSIRTTLGGGWSALWSKIQQPNYCRSIPAYAGARAYVEALRQLGHVRALTVASATSHWARERRLWLHEDFGFDDADIEIVHECYEKYEYPGDILVEDKAETVMYARHQHRQLLDRPWNRYANDLAGGIRVTDYNDSLQQIRAFL